MQDDGGVVLHVGDDDSAGPVVGQQREQFGFDGDGPFDELAAESESYALLRTASLRLCVPQPHRPPKMSFSRATSPASQAP